MKWLISNVIFFKNFLLLVDHWAEWLLLSGHLAKYIHIHLNHNTRISRRLLAGQAETRQLSGLINIRKTLIVNFGDVNHG